MRSIPVLYYYVIVAASEFVMLIVLTWTLWIAIKGLARIERRLKSLDKHLIDLINREDAVNWTEDELPSGDY